MPDRKLKQVVEAYFTDLRLVRGSGGATDERSMYVPLANLLNAVSGALRPKVFCSQELVDQGAGLPNFGLYANRPRVEREAAGWVEPERGRFATQSRSRNDPCTKRPQYHYTRYTPSSAAGLSLILRMDRSTSAMIRLLTRGTSWLIPSAASSAAQSVIRPSRLASSTSGSGDPVASVSITRPVGAWDRLYTLPSSAFRCTTRLASPVS